MPGLTTYPPFPDDVPTHPLLVVDYGLVKQNNSAEIDKLWEAATKLGFWYLKNHGADAEVEGMFDMGAETMDLPLEEKMKFEQGDEGSNFGYKAAGANAVDASGTLDTVEFINVAKDDALAWPRKVHRDYPSTVNARMESTIRPFILKSAEVTTTLVNIFNDKLGLPKDALAKRHKLEDLSFCHSRCLKKLPSPESPSDKKALGEHTDFGTLSFLHNRLGGLQVLPPGSTAWYYIKPIPGHAICNVGDALAIMSGGILRSNLHRVVTPPKEQANYERWSLVYFSRPSNDVVLHALTEESPLIAEAVALSPDPSKFFTTQTSADWVMRRVRNRRRKHMTGPEKWEASKGTEHTDPQTLQSVAV